MRKRYSVGLLNSHVERDENFQKADSRAFIYATLIGMAVVFEQIGRNPPEPVAIWSRS